MNLSKDNWSTTLQFMYDVIIYLGVKQSDLECISISNTKSNHCHS